MGSAAPLTVQVDSRDDIASIALSGNLDLASVLILVDQLTRTERDGVKAIVLDLSDLDFFDSTGLQAFLQAMDRSNANGHRLTLVGASPAVRNVFEVTGTEFLLDGGDAKR